MTRPSDIHSTDEITRERARKRLGDMGDVFDRPPNEVSAWQLAFGKLAEYDQARADARLTRDLNRTTGEKLD